MFEVIERKYDLKEKLGQGGFGDVYRALRRDDGREVAIKFLRDDIPDSRRRFVREVTMLREYVHPSIMVVLEDGARESPAYYVMPFYRNGSLKARVGKVQGREFWYLFEELIGVLSFLAERNAFHRDLKPENILVGDDGRPILCDFGLGSDPLLTENFTRGYGGTVGYAAPELTRTRNGASPKSDIYSLGATVFHVLTGKHPGEAAKLDIAPYVANFPIEVRDMILAMVDPDPARRPSARDITGWIAQLRKGIRPLTLKARAAAGAAEASGSTPPWLVFLFVALLLGAAVGAGLWIYSLFQDSEKHA
jgi:serine/threonine protein kinase